MGRPFVVTVGGREFSLPVNFAALDALARSGIDPGRILRAKEITLRDAVETVGLGLRLCGERGDNDTLVVGKVSPEDIGTISMGWLLALVSSFAVDKPGPKGPAPGTETPAGT